jgi:hypothetical protein
MRTIARRAVPPTLTVASLVLFAAPARAQFEEPDTIPRFSIGPTFEVVFRGQRGESLDGEAKIAFGGGPPVGARLEYRLTRTLAFGAGGSWARLNEQQELQNSKNVNPGGFTQWQGVGELMLKVKPNIPGYFILGGGARHIVPDSDSSELNLHNEDPFTDIMGILGAGIELGSRTRRVFKLDFRFYLVSPAEQDRMDSKSMALDFAAGLSLLFRL